MRDFNTVSSQGATLPTRGWETVEKQSSSHPQVTDSTWILSPQKKRQFLSAVINSVKHPLNWIVLLPLSYSPQIPFFFLEIIFQNKLLIASTFLNLVSLGTQFKILGTTSSSINRHSRWILELDQLNSDKDPIFVDKWGDLNPWYAAASQLLRFSPAVNWNYEDGRWSIFYELKLIKNKYMVSVRDQECRTGWLWLLVFRRLVKGKETGRLG